MNILLDHCMDMRYLRLLRAWGHTVSALHEHTDVRALDSEVLTVAQGLKAVTITVDRDFLNIKQYPPEQFAGIVVVDDDQRTRNTITTMLKAALEAFESQGLAGKLLTVQASGYKLFPPDGGIS